MNNQLEYDLKRIKREDVIWIIYIIIIVLALFSNYFEKQYISFKNNYAHQKFSNINKLIFTILLFIYIYFVIDSYNQLKRLKNTDSKRKINITTLTFIGSIINLIGGLIFLYVALNNTEPVPDITIE